MKFPFGGIAEMFRDFVIAGDANSGVHEPQPSEFRTWGSYVESNLGIRFISVAAFKADTALGYVAGNAAYVQAGDVIRAGIWSYTVQASAATDYDLISQGGVKVIINGTKLTGEGFGFAADAQLNASNNLSNSPTDDSPAFCRMLRRYEALAAAGKRPYIDLSDVMGLIYFGTAIDTGDDPDNPGSMLLSQGRDLRIYNSTQVTIVVPSIGRNKRLINIGHNIVSNRGFTQITNLRFQGQATDADPIPLAVPFVGTLSNFAGISVAGVKNTHFYVEEADNSEMAGCDFSGGGNAQPTQNLVGAVFAVWNGTTLEARDSSNVLVPGTFTGHVGKGVLVNGAALDARRPEVAVIATVVGDGSSCTTTEAAPNNVAFSNNRRLSFDVMTGSIVKGSTSLTVDTAFMTAATDVGRPIYILRAGTEDSANPGNSENSVLHAMITNVSGDGLTITLDTPAGTTVTNDHVYLCPQFVTSIPTVRRVDEEVTGEKTNDFVITSTRFENFAGVGIMLGAGSKMRFIGCKTHCRSGGRNDFGNSRYHAVIDKFAGVVEFVGHIMDQAITPGTGAFLILGRSTKVSYNGGQFPRQGTGEAPFHFDAYQRPFTTIGDVTINNGHCRLIVNDVPTMGYQGQIVIYGSPRLRRCAFITAVVPKFEEAQARGQPIYCMGQNFPVFDLESTDNATPAMQILDPQRHSGRLIVEGSSPDNPNSDYYGETRMVTDLTPSARWTDGEGRKGPDIYKGADYDSILSGDASDVYNGASAPNNKLTVVICSDSRLVVVAKNTGRITVTMAFTTPQN